MHQGLRSIPTQNAGGPPPRRSSVFQKTLIRAANDVPRSQFRRPQASDHTSTHTVSIGTALAARNAATRLAKALLKSAECVQPRSVLNASVRGRRVS